MSFRVAISAGAVLLSVVLGAPLSAQSAIDAASWKAAGTGPETLEMVAARLPRLPRASRSVPDAPAPPPVADPPAPDAGIPPVAPRTARAAGQPFAGVAGLQLRLPAGVHTVGFHEGGGIPLHPVGVPRHNANMARLSKAPVDEVTGPEYIILGSRNRRGGPTTAIDMAMPFNHPVQSPVSGVVESADSYLLYHRVPDNRLVIRPDARPDLRVVLLHLNGVTVQPGDRVTAGQSIVALTARQLPFASQVDRYAGPQPHVHIEVRQG